MEASKNDIELVEINSSRSTSEHPYQTHTVIYKDKRYYIGWNGFNDNITVSTFDKIKIDGCDNCEARRQRFLSRIPFDLMRYALEVFKDKINQ